MNIIDITNILVAIVSAIDGVTSFKKKEFVFACLYFAIASSLSVLTLVHVLA